MAGTGIEPAPLLTREASSDGTKSWVRAFMQTQKSVAGTIPTGGKRMKMLQRLLMMSVVLPGLAMLQSANAAAENSVTRLREFPILLAQAPVPAPEPEKE